MREIIFASQNRGKIYEVSNILNNSNIKILSLLEFEDIPEIIENGDSFEANAKIKAFEVFNKFKLPAIGDDSGLVVEQLNGRPGIYSARYAGEYATDEENNIKLINELKNFSQPHHAKFVCTAAYFNGNDYTVAVGEIKGEIIKNPRGNNGFGYDPLFVPHGFENTMAELTIEEKNKISHRAIAFNELKKLLKNNR